MSGVVALGFILVQVTHTESGPVSAVGGQGHGLYDRQGGISLRNGQGIGSPVCSHVGPSSMYDTRQLGLPTSNYIGHNIKYFLFPFTPLVPARPRAKSAIYDCLVLQLFFEVLCVL